MSDGRPRTLERRLSAGRPGSITDPFSLPRFSESSVCIEWRKGEFICNLFVDLIFKKTTIRYVDPKSKRMLTMIFLYPFSVAETAHCSQQRFHCQFFKHSSACGHPATSVVVCGEAVCPEQVIEILLSADVQVQTFTAGLPLLSCYSSAIWWHCCWDSYWQC